MPAREADEIVLAEPLAQHLHLGLNPARVLERLGKLGDARSISLIAIHTHDIPQTFPGAAVEEAERARGVALGSRTDLRDMPLITIDGADARDFDDAVFAEPDPDHAGGFRLLVAIADVAHYVRPGSDAGPRRRYTRQQCLFPRPRRADAARGAVQRLVQPAPERGPRLPVRRNAHRPRRPQDRATGSAAA